MMSTSISFADPAPTAPVVYVALDGSGDFNCDGGDENGVGDDQVEIQQAIDYVLANDGFTTIRLKAGTYYINDTIYIAGKKDQKVILEGEEGTVLKLSTDVCWPKSQAMIQQKTTDMLADLPDAYLGNIIIRGFTMDGNGYNVTRALNTDGSERKLEYPNHNGISYYTLIFFRGCEDVEICNMYLTQNMNDGFLANTCKHVKFHDNIIDEIGHDGMYAYKCEYVEAYNNIIYIQTNSGLRAGSSNHVKFYNNIISGRDKGGPGIEIQKENMINNAGGYTYMRDIEIFNNVIYNIKYAGIWAFGTISIPGYEYPSEDAEVHIHHNIVYNCGYYAGAGDAATNLRLKGGIVIDGFNALIENNVIDSCHAAGINVHEWDPAKPSPPELFTLTIRNNIISNTKDNPLVGRDGEESGYGIYYELSDKHDFIVEYNCFYNNNGDDLKDLTPLSNVGNLFGVDPCFADPENHDYHLKSEAGRWDGTTFVYDDVTSPCIDAGDPNYDYSNEPMNNGGRINIGRYGNTPEASRSSAIEGTAAILTGAGTVDGLNEFSLTYRLLGAEDITAHDVTISYDKEMFDFVTVKPVLDGTTVPDDVYHDEENGIVRAILASLGDEYAVNGDADILEFVFNPKSSGTGIIAITKAELGNSAGGVITASTPEQATRSVTVSEKAALASAIQAAQEIYDNAVEGIDTGQYPAGTKSILGDAIAAAIAVRDDSSATSEEVDQAVEDLNAAVAWFQGLVITASTGDVNGVPGIDIGDLGKIAANYGKNSESEDWNNVRHMDINGDGEIGLYELAFIAKKLLSK
ncbi:MAG: hypothetical protein GX045_01545 [Clostridiaceae bacterium]|nr:hypothetical protein [Clostridiaceae bacterium]